MGSRAWQGENGGRGVNRLGGFWQHPVPKRAALPLSGKRRSPGRGTFGLELSPHGASVRPCPGRPPLRVRTPVPPRTLLCGAPTLTPTSTPTPLRPRPTPPRGPCFSFLPLLVGPSKAQVALYSVLRTPHRRLTD
ncbi:hypothetical protein VFPFJ_09237 [Purpureocillium lilacinum]|uniref:Uncharacterized protein n=1 Tax=Purpureocillium lilacinum TaxID=33203 RepID=A0A179GU19_PURLI|nr:hypothetical protein VFPFJ_09237 [Purpureocillium lilacinum]OAQ80783.1 hypothetical protein VFPFJ_09237 [Purpureocillium lilacinum]